MLSLMSIANAVVFYVILFLRGVMGAENYRGENMIEETDMQKTSGRKKAIKNPPKRVGLDVN